jgi:hypothetical protein
MDEAERSSLAELLETRRFDKGDTIFNFGDAGDALYIIRSGSVQVFIGSADKPSLDVPALQSKRRGPVGLFVDNGSDGAFANLRIAPSYTGTPGG